jgi:CBS domain-containing protein
MQVHQILKGKATGGVVTIDPGARLDAAVALLAQERIGSVVVSADGQRALGILSERDIVRVLAEQGAAAMSDAVEAHMTRDIMSCARSDSAESVLQRMTDGRFRHMPVVEDGRMWGIVTIGDVVKARLSELAMEKTALEGMITSQW